MEARDIGTINGVQSFLIESNRAGSAIDAGAPEANNGRWTSQTNIDLKRGDRVSVECVAIESTGASNSGSTIEFSGKNIKLGDTILPFSDDQCVLEFNFYMLNNSHNTINLPIKFKNTVKVDTTTNTPPPVIPANVELTGWEFLVGWGPDPAGPGPFNLLIKPSYTKYQQQVNKGYWGGINAEYATSNGGGTGVYNTPALNDIPNTTNQNAPCDYQYPGCSFQSQAGFNFNQPVPDPPNADIRIVSSYDLYELRLDDINGISQVVVGNPGDEYDTIVLQNHADLLPTFPAPAANIPNLRVDYEPQQTPMPGGYSFQGKNLPFAQGFSACFADNSNSTASGGFIPPHGKAGKDMSNPIISCTSFRPDDTSASPYPPGIYRAGIRVVKSTVRVISVVFSTPGIIASTAQIQVIAVVNAPGTQNPYKAAQNPDGSTKKLYGGYNSHDLILPPADLSTGFLQPWGTPGTNGYHKQGRMGIGLYNQSAQNVIVNGYVAPIGSAEALEIDMCKPNVHFRGGSLLWEQTRCYGNMNAAADVPQLTANNLGEESYGLELSTCDMRNHKDNNAYIMTRPDYMGPQPHPNGEGLCPELQPLSCFVHVKAGSAFEDVSSLADIFTNAFHAINKLLTTQGTALQKYIENSEYPFNKKNQIFPLFSEGYYDSSSLEESAVPYPATYKKSALWTRVAPMWLGNCIKCIPANFDPGTDWKYQEGSPYIYWYNDIRDYLKAGANGDWCWNNTLYGNMGLRDMAKCQAGDKLCRLEVWDGNTIIHPYRDIARSVVLNTQLKKSVCKSVATGSSPYHFPPEMLTPGAGVPGYIRKNPPFQLNSTYFQRGEVIYTNIQYQNDGWETMPGADATTASGYALNATNEEIQKIKLVRYKNLDDIQWAMRKKERYMIQNNPHAINGAAKQIAQPWWVYDMDLGMSDGSQRLNKNTVGAGQPIPYEPAPGPPWVPPTVLNTVDPGKFGIMTPIQTNWMRDFPASAGGALNPVTPNPAVAPAYLAWAGVGITPYATPFDLPEGSSYITPSQCIAGCGSEVNYQQSKNLGNLEVFSKWNPRWEVSVATQSGEPIYAPFQTPYAPIGDLYEVIPIGVGAYAQLHTFGANPQWIYDYTPSKERNIGAFPYQYQDEDGTRHELVAYCVSKEYNAQSDVPSEIGVVQTRGTWEMGDLNWGDFIGFSPQFGYDQPAILPINNDYIHGQEPLSWDINDGNGVVTRQPDPRWKANNLNSIWVGASNAKMLFDQGKNRFELGGLYTTNLLSALNAGPVPSGDPANTQIGEAIATLNGLQNDGNVAPAGTKQAAWAPQTSAIQPIPGVWDWDNRNQGVEDSVTGICLANIYHASEGWVPPETLNPQNLTSPYMNNIDGSGADVNPYSKTTTNPQDFLNQTAENYQTFKDTLVLATADNFEGTILNKMGFEFNQLLPYQGSQENRYSEWTYGKDNITIQDQGVKPLMLNAELDTAATQNLNTYAYVKGTVMRAGFTPPPPAPPVPEIPPQFGNLPLYGFKDADGTPLYRTGQLNNQEVNLDATIGAVLTARNQPSLYACPYYIILTDMVSTSFQKGQMAQNAIYYGLKSYSAGQYFYVYASGYSQLVQADRLVQSITTELRNPLTGEIARVGKNSSIIYKVERDISLPPLTMTGDGVPIEQQGKEQQAGEENTEFLKTLNKMFEEQKLQETELVSIKTFIGNEIAGGGGGIPGGGGGGGGNNHDVVGRVREQNQREREGIRIRADEGDYAARHQDETKGVGRDGRHVQELLDKAKGRDKDFNEFMEAEAKDREEASETKGEANRVESGRDNRIRDRFNEIKDKYATGAEAARAATSWVDANPTHSGTPETEYRRLQNSEEYQKAKEDGKTGRYQLLNKDKYKQAVDKALAEEAKNGDTRGRGMRWTEEHGNSASSMAALSQFDSDHPQDAQPTVRRSRHIRPQKGGKGDDSGGASGGGKEDDE